MNSGAPVSVQDQPTRVIPGDQVELHPFSIADPNGQLFSWKGDLYRGIRPGHEELYRDLAQRGFLDEWSNAGYLVFTEMTDLAFPGFAVIFKHRRIDPVSLPVEWPPVMLRDAVLRTLDFGLELTRHGLIIKDPHPWNTVFDRTDPVYVDLTSIVRKPAGTLWPGYRNFGCFCYNPLLLMSLGYDTLARSLVEQDQGVPSEVVRRLTGRVLRHPFRRWERALRRTAAILPFVRRGDDDTAILLERLRSKVEAIELPEAPFSHDDSRAAGHQVLVERIRKTGARSILDLNCHSADFPLALASAGIRVVAFARDPGVATAIYESARGTDRDIFPVLMDFRRPTPGRGLGNSQSIPAEQRFSAELALVRGLSGAMLQERPMAPRQMADGLAGFACRHLILEWSRPASHEPGGAIDSEWAKSLTEALQKHFPRVTPVAADGDIRLVECER